MPGEREFDQLEAQLDYRFRERRFLIEALSHSSYVNENIETGMKSNERMEFLGDAVLQLIITRHLYERFPGCSEGELTLMRSVLVSEGTLAMLAREMKLGECLYLGKGEASSGGAERRSNLSNALEAVIAAVYLDGALPEVERVTRLIFKPELERIEAHQHDLNYKNLLQHYSQTRDGEIPEYSVVRSHGPQHERLFEVEVRIAGEPLGKGNGSNKKEAEQEAARQALIALGELGGHIHGSPESTKG